MNPIILGIFLLGVFITMALPPLLMAGTARKKRFNVMDNAALIRVNIHAGMMKGRLRLSAYLVPIPIVILVRCFPVEKVQPLIIGAAFVVVFACLAAAQVFGVMDKLATDEMENRKAADDIEK